MFESCFLTVTSFRQKYFKMTLKVADVNLLMTFHLLLARNVLKNSFANIRNFFEELFSPLSLLHSNGRGSVGNDMTDLFI